MITYSTKEAAVKLGVSTRAVQKRCKNDEVRKKDNMYLITDLLLEKWRVEIESNEPTNVPTNEPYNGTQEKVIRDLENELKDLKAEGSLINGKQGKYIKKLEKEVEELESDIGDLESFSNISFK